MLERFLFVTTFVSTVFCAAVNLYTLQVGYPLWRVVGLDSFAAVHRDYLERLWPVITLPHVVMFFASAAMMWWRPGFVGRWEAVAVFVLDAGVVVVSAFAAGPIHARFERTGMMDPEGYRALVEISALRVVLMTTACGVLCMSLLRALRVLT